MQKSCFVINLKRAEHHQDLFLKDPKSDFFLVCAEKVFPLHKKFLLRSQYLAAKSEQNQKVYVIQKLNKPQILEPVLSLLYGNSITIERTEIILDYLEVISVLKIEEAERQIYAELHNNFHEYGFFTLFQTARRFCNKKLQERCFRELLNEQFEQINYNRFDLFQCQLNLFEDIIREHQRRAKYGKIQGFDRNFIKNLIEDYCEAKMITLDPEQLLELEEEDNDLLPEQLPKRNASLIVPTSNREEAMKELCSSNYSMSKSVHDAMISDFKVSVQEENIRCKLQKIREVNEELSKKNEEMTEELAEVASTLSVRDEKSCQSQYDIIFNKLSEVEQESNDQNLKVQVLQKQIQQMLKNTKQCSTEDSCSIKNSPQKVSQSFDQSGSCFQQVRPRRKSAQVLNQYMPILAHGQGKTFK